MPSLSPDSAPVRSRRTAVILAAGKGTRFKSRRSKILHPLCGRPMAAYLLDSLMPLEVDRTLMVVGHESQAVREAFSHRQLEFALQSRQLGTGHALQIAVDQLGQIDGALLVLNGDCPLIRSQSLERLCRQVEEGASMALLTAAFDDPHGYGRIVREEGGQVAAIVEQKDASPSQREIREVNAGFYCFRARELGPALSRLDRDNRAGELYLTDLVGIFRGQGKRVEALISDLPRETLGVNDRAQLAEAEEELLRGIAQDWMRRGVTMLDPSSVRIESGVELASDVTLYPGVILEGETRVGQGCVVHAYCHLSNAVLEEDVLVDHCSVIRDSRIGAGARVGPFAHLRAGAEIGSQARIGNFVEVKKSSIGDGSKASHLTYLGDAVLGKGVNVGAGTITCNYDGVRKNRTVIDDGVFIGSNSQLIAPVKVGEGAYVAAGSTVTEDVPSGALAIARSRQSNKLDWAEQESKKIPTNKEGSREDKS